MSPASAQLGAGAVRLGQQGKQRPSRRVWAPASGPVSSALLNRQGYPTLGGPQAAPAGRAPEVRTTAWLTHARVRCLIHPGARDGFPEGERGEASPQLALKFCSAPSGSRPRKALFTCGLPTAWAGWQLAFGERWRLLGGRRKSRFLLTLGGRPRGQGRLPTGPCGRTHSRCTPPLPGPEDSGCRDQNPAVDTDQGRW